PSRVRNSPGAMVRETSSTAVKLSKRLVRCWSSRMGGGIEEEGERGKGKREREGGKTRSPFPFPFSLLLGRLHLIPHFLVLVPPGAPLPEVHFGAVLGDIALRRDLLRRHIAFGARTGHDVVGHVGHELLSERL